MKSKGAYMLQNLRSYTGNDAKAALAEMVFWTETNSQIIKTGKI